MDKKYFLGFFLLFISLFLLFGCTFFGGDSPGGDDSNSIGFSSAVLSGHVYNERGVLVSEVDVLLNGVKQTFTDSSGSYKVEIPLGENKLISFDKNGFVPIHKSLDFVYKTESYLEVTMFPQAEFVLVDSTKESKVEMNNAALTTDAEGFVIKGTSTVATSASVSLTPFDPADEEQAKAFPGEYSGTRMDGSNTSIESFGFMKIEALSEEGKQLDIAKGKSATVKQPISAELKDSAPDSIPLWYFDEAQNTWVERGVAEKVCVAGECYYEGKIDTIGSWWNCDQPQNTSEANCNGSSGTNSNGGGKKGTFKDLMKKLGEKAGMWALDKAIGHIPVVGAFYDAYKLARNVVNSASTGTLSQRMGGAGGAGLKWAVEKILGKFAPPVALALDVAQLAGSMLKEVVNYGLSLYNNQFNASCSAKGIDYRGSSSSRFSPNLSPIDLTNGQADTPINPSTQPGVIVRSNSQADITVDGLDMTSESIQITTGDTGQSVDVPVDDFAAVSVPIEINPSGPGALVRIQITFTNLEGKKTSISKTLSNTNPIAYLTILVRSGRTGAIEINEISFAGTYHKTYDIPALLPGEIHELEEQQIDIGVQEVPKFDSNASKDSNFSCPAHYAYVKEVKAPKGNGLTMSSSYNVLYYDGEEIDRSNSIRKVRLFGDNLAYEKEVYFDTNKVYCGDFYYYDDAKSGENKDCTKGEIHIIYNGKDIGKGSNPEVWANHIAFSRSYPDNGFVYDGEVYGADCKRVSYELWGDNIAYSCDGNVFWNNAKVGVGEIKGVHKNFLLLYTTESTDESCFHLYKSGVKVADPKGLCSMGIFGMNSGKAGVFGDNYWYAEPTGKWTSDNGNEIFDIYYNGKLVFSGEYPQAVAFGKDFLYGNYDELFFNGAKVGKREGTNDILTNISLSNGNYGFFSGNSANYDGTFYEANYLWEGELKLFGNNWLFTDGTRLASLHSQKIFFNSQDLGEALFGSVSLLDNKLAYIKAEPNNTSEYYGKLIYDGKVIDGNYFLFNGYALFGDHILYVKDYAAKPTLGGYSTSEYFVDEKAIGLRYYAVDGNEELKNVHVWPKFGSDTEIGTERSNTYNIEDNVEESREKSWIEVDGHQKENTFDDIYLYCTNQWK